MPLLNVFDSDAFSALSLTAAINRLKPQYALLSSMGVTFSDQGVDTTHVAIENQGDVLNLLTTKPRGAEPTLNVTGKRDLVSAEIPHNPIIDRVIPKDVQNVRRFGSDNELEAVSDKLTMKLASMRRKLEITQEYRRWKALEGLIVDADGATLLNLYTLLGKTRKEIDMVLGTAGTNIIAKIEEGLDHMEENAEGEILGDPIGICGKTWWEKFRGHAKVEKAFENWQGRSDLLGTDLRKGFQFGGVTWFKHIGQVSYVNSAGVATMRKFVPDGDALLLPRGTQETFLGAYAPADMMEAVNTLGLPLYGSSKQLPHGKGAELYAETNYLPYVTRPQLVIRLHSSN